MAKKISVSKIIETNSDLNIMLNELQKKIGYDTQIDNHKQLIRILFKLLDTEITNYVKTEDEINFSNALKIVSLLEMFTNNCIFSENDAHIHLYKQARLLIKITGLIGEFLHKEIENNLILLKEKINKLEFKNEKNLEKKFQSQISELEKIIEGKRLLKLLEENKIKIKAQQEKENCKIFTQVLDKCFKSIELENRDIYYYLNLLHILSEKINYNKIDSSYLEKITNPKSEHLTRKYQIILKELEKILKMKKTNNTPEETLIKYDINYNFCENTVIDSNNFQILIYKESQPVALTIDGDAKSTIKDDALSIKKEKNGYRLGIHIADVGNFIIPNSPLDENIKQKFKSLYLPDQVLHMISPNISKNYLSLDAGKKRNVISLYAKISESGEIESYTFLEETITIDQNLSYTLADKILRHEISLPNDTDYNLKLLEHATSLISNSQRNEYRLIKELIREITVPEDPISEKIINESMVLYNRLFAEYLSQFHNLPVIYRVHDKPQPTSIEIFNEKKELINSDLINILKECYPRAYYSLDNIGHYGLKLDTYSHSSSPIRRYTDIFMQRLYFLSQQQLTIEQLKELEHTAIEFVEYANKKEKELKMFEDEYEQAYIKTFKPIDS